MPRARNPVLYDYWEICSWIVAITIACSRILCVSRGGEGGETSAKLIRRLRLIKRRDQGCGNQAGWRRRKEGQKRGKGAWEEAKALPLLSPKRPAHPSPFFLRSFQHFSHALKSGSLEQGTIKRHPTMDRWNKIDSRFFLLKCQMPDPLCRRITDD